MRSGGNAETMRSRKAAPMIDNSAESLISPISPRELRVPTRDAASNSPRKQAFRASRSPPQWRPKQGILCPIAAHFMPNSAPFHQSPRSAFSPAGRGFGRFLPERPFIVSWVVSITIFSFHAAAFRPPQAPFRQAALGAAAPAVARLRAVFRAAGEPTLSPRRLARNRKRLRGDRDTWASALFDVSLRRSASTDSC